MASYSLPMGKSEDEIFMGRALVEAELALDQGEFPVGCVIVMAGEVVATGSRKNSAIVQGGGEIDHAEIIALRRLVSERPGIDLGRVALYSTLEPCLMCHATLLVNGVREIVFAYEDAMGGGTGLALSQLPPLYREMRVRVRAGVRRRESLALFQRFFSAPDTTYLQDTFLADYTLKQPLD